MLFMVVERFKGGNQAAVGERFRDCGRMMPETVKYLASWIEPGTLRCFQLMEAPDREVLDPWVERWEDLMEFEIVRVETSREFWAKFYPPEEWVPGTA